MPVIVTCQSKVSKIRQITGNFETGRSMYNFDVGDKPSMSSNTFGLIISASESTNLYNALASTYQWFDKTKDYASEAGPMLSQNNLSRSYGKVSRSRDRRRLITGHSTSVK